MAKAVQQRSHQGPRRGGSFADGDSADTSPDCKRYFNQAGLRFGQQSPPFCVHLADRGRKCADQVIDVLLGFLAELCGGRDCGGAHLLGPSRAAFFKTLLVTALAFGFVRRVRCPAAFGGQLARAAFSYLHDLGSSPLDRIERKHARLQPYVAADNAWHAGLPARPVPRGRARRGYTIMSFPLPLPRMTTSPASSSRRTTSTIFCCAASTSLTRTGPMNSISSLMSWAARSDMFLKIFSLSSS